MNDNLPVTEREIDYAASEVLVSRTDAQGIITAASESFARISGYSEAELIGSPHNIVRHPDMPAWVFEDLWATLKSGFPWRGILKNRAKNGDHYWIRATVTPVVHQGQTIGYLSQRKKPAREEVAEAERRYRAAPASGPGSGKTLRSRFSGLPLQYKVQLLVQPLLLVLLSATTWHVSQTLQESMLRDVRARAGGVAMQVIDGANMLMITGSITEAESRKTLIRKVIEGQRLVSLRLVRAPAVVEQFGAGLPEEHLDDPAVQAVIRGQGSADALQPAVTLTEAGGRNLMRVITPYAGSHDFHGTDCLTCHQIQEGTVTGVSDATFDLTDNFAEIRKITFTLIAAQLVLQLILFFLIGWVIHRFVVKPVREVLDHVSEIVDGDFSRPVSVAGRDELGRVLCAVQSNKLLIGAVIDQIASAARSLEAHSSDLSRAAAGASSGSREQSNASHAMASGIEQISVSIDQVAGNTDDARKAAERSSAVASKGAELVSQVVEDMGAISSEVVSAAESIRELGVRSENIGGIVKTIRDIADQTNLLALNAAIEAARAGEQGRGFAVVADEVRKLAEQTSRSTSTIGEVAAGIRSGTEMAARVIDGAVQKVRHGVDLAQAAGNAIAEIDSGAGQVRANVADIALAIHEQSLASRQIASNVEKISRMAEENSAAINRVDEAAKTLETLSHGLGKMAQQFTI